LILNALLNKRAVAIDCASSKGNIGKKYLSTQSKSSSIREACACIMEDSSTAIDREEKGNQYKNPSCQIGLM